MPDSAVAKPNTKALLLDHARVLFARHGYEGVSMRDIAGSVGVRQSAIYNHFSSKQDLLVTLMVTHMENVLDAMRTAVAHKNDPIQRLEAFVRFHVTYHIDFPDDVFLAYMELRSLEKSGHDKVVPLRQAYEKALKTTLEAGRDAGVFLVENPSVTTRALLAMLTGVTVWFRDDGALDRNTVAESYVRAALRSVGVNSEAC